MSARTNPLPGNVTGKLLEGLEGSIHVDAVNRATYATDASMYKKYPRGVCHPASRKDLTTIMEIAKKHDIPVLPRGAGTSLAGQTVGEALILDFSTHLNQILSVNNAAETATVEPGVVLEDLNQHLQPQQLKFGPDVATANRATIGGMIGNNSAGSHSIRYGQTSDHINWIEAVLPGGKTVKLEPVDLHSLELSDAQNGPEDLSRNESLALKLQKLAKSHSSEIREAFPDLLRHVGGYRIQEFLNTEEVNPADILPGSEGTLALLHRVNVDLVPKPKTTVLGIVQFQRLHEALSAVQDILKTDPYAVELVDDVLLDLARDHETYHQYTNFLQGNPKAILMVEYEGNHKRQLDDKLASLEELCRSELQAHHVNKLTNQAAQNQAWKVRKAGLGIMMSMAGDERTAAFVEDTAVPLDQLAFYGRRFRQILNKYDLHASFYGHASVGLLHIRPFLNLKNPKHIEKIKPFSQEIFELAKSCGGTYSGEHGEGRARSWFSDQYYAPPINNLFRNIKDLFDPDHLLNPGNMVGGTPEPDEDLRYDGHRQTSVQRSYLDHDSQEGLQRALERCNGNGLCRKTESGTMCPSYMATGRERDSTRARANALREIIAGDLSKSQLTSSELHQIMDLCIGCKACKSECPSHVDMARMNFEYMAHKHRQEGTSLRDWLFGKLGTLLRYTPDIPSFKQFLSRTVESGIKPYVSRLLNVHPDRPFPTPNPRTFFQLYKQQYSSHESPSDRKRSSSFNDTLLLYIDTFTNYFEPEIGLVAVDYFEQQDYQVLVEPFPCCGRPAFSKGLYQEWKNTTQKNYQQLKPYVNNDIPIVFLEPSCYSAIGSDYGYTLPEEQFSELESHTFLWDEFLARENVSLKGNPASTRHSSFIHPHCHQNALLGTKHMESIFHGVSNYSVTFSEAGCCGMAGTFGYEQEHYQISRKMAEQRLLPRIQNQSDHTGILAPGFSCRHQINDLTSRTAKHPIEHLNNMQ